MEHRAVLYSGGIDSTTALYWALKQGGRVTALTFLYGQRHRVETRLARKLTSALKIPHVLLRVALNQIGGSALTDPSLPLPRYRETSEIPGEIPTTYVPFRNGIFLALAAAWAEVNEAREIVCGFNVADSPDYPDTRRAFVRSMEAAIREGTGAAFGKPAVRIRAPFLDWKKAEIIRKGLEWGADYSYSISCYAGKEVPCLECAACLLRRKAWEEVGEEDHLLARLEREGKR